MKRALFPALCVAIASCSSVAATTGPTLDEEIAAVPEGCDPIGYRCGFPFPNDLWLSSDSAGKKRIKFHPNALPKAQIDSVPPINPDFWSDHDGWSAGQESIAYFDDPSGEGLPNEDNIPLSLRTDSPTILMEAETGALVPHFSEIDLSTFSHVDRSLIVHPVVRLKDATRYIVAIRHIVADSDGKAFAPTAGFRALRDKITTKSAAVEARRAHFEEIFAKLESKGIARADLQIAWDYTTASQPNNTADLLFMRDDALAQVGDLGPEYTITKVDPDPNPFLSKILYGTMKVPLYLDKAEPGGHIVRDEKGLPKRNGMGDYEFLVLVPKSISDVTPAAILQNGHGLLGRKTEGTGGYFAEMCERHNYVGLAVDWVGMAHDDVDNVIAAASGDITTFRNEVDRQHQGFVNALLAMRMMKGRMKDEPNLQMNGKTVLDPSKTFYRGDSQGGIFGATYMSISTDVTRGLLGEPGMPYNLLLDRSVDFSSFKLLIKGNYPNGADVRMLLGLLQITWDRTEPNGYAASMAPAHQVLMHVAIGDHQVTPLGAHFLARTIGAKNIKPVNRSIWGIDEVDVPFSGGSALVEFDFGLPPAPKSNIPMSLGDDPHDAVRKLHESMDQTDKFLREGIVAQFCDGPCNPT